MRGRGTDGTGAIPAFMAIPATVQCCKGSEAVIPKQVCCDPFEVVLGGFPRLLSGASSSDMHPSQEMFPLPFIWCLELCALAMPGAGGSVQLPLMGFGLAGPGWCHLEAARSSCSMPRSCTTQPSTLTVVRR